MPANSPIFPRPSGCSVPLTAMQLYSWRHYSKQGSPPNRRMCAASLRIVGRLDSCLLANSIEIVVNRHESLRTRFVTDDEVPRQHIDPRRSFELLAVDLATKKFQSDNALNLDSVTREFLDEKVDLSVGPMFAAKLWRLSEQEHVLVLALDHIVGDSISNVILTREILDIYGKGSMGLPLSSPKLALQFPDYAVWQEQVLESWRQKHESYWKNRLEGVSTVRLPKVEDSVPSAHSVVATRHFGFGASLSAQLRRISQRERIPLPAVVLTAYAIVMSQWCNQHDLLVSFASHGRHHRPELEGMIGFLACWTFLRIDTTQESTLLFLLRHVSQEFSAALEHQEYFMVPDTFPKIVTEVEFNWLPAHTTADSVSRIQIGNGEVQIQPYSVKSLGFVGRFHPFFYDSRSGIGLTVHYRPSQMAPDVVQQFGSDVRRIASDIAERPQARISSLSERYGSSSPLQ